MSTFLLEIVTPERKVYAKEVNMVSVKGVEGELGILAHHIPLVTPLKVAPVVIKTNGKVEELVNTSCNIPLNPPSPLKGDPRALTPLDPVNWAYELRLRGYRRCWWKERYEKA